jgi:cellulose synthase (UDP-forming)
LSSPAFPHDGAAVDASCTPAPDPGAAAPLRRLPHVERRRADRPPPTGPLPSQHALPRRRRVVHALLGLAWAALCLRFWLWWWQPEHVGSPVLHVAASAPLFYLTTFLPSFYWFYVGRMRRPADRAPRPGRRVALITPCVPSHESLEVVRAQLQALAAVRYPHDSWILDEGNDPRIRALAAEFGVRHFTRKGVAAYNDAGPPFQRRTKAGNVNAWIDHVEREGYSYEFFVQFDIDHHPAPEYLHRTLGHLDDPQVAWVQAPSVCGNLDRWTARGLAEQDLVLQGPLQMGFYGHCRTPFIIGSHTTYRMSAIRQIGGFQPTRAEDHLDTVVLAAHGYEGVYVPEVIATGDGPEDLQTYLGQQFAWAYSMTQILLHHTPRLLRRHRPAQAFQFLMAQTWYPLWSLSVAALWVLPIVSLLSGRAIADVELGRFLAFHLAMLAMSSLMWWWTRDCFQPAGVRLSWRALLVEVVRWPIVLWAFVNAVLRVQRPYMITPKGRAPGAPPAAHRLYWPQFVLVAAGLGAVGVFRLAIGRSPTEGYLLLVLLNVVMVVALLVAATCLELRELRAPACGLRGALVLRARLLAALAGVCAATVLATAAVWAPVVAAVR